MNSRIELYNSSSDTEDIEIYVPLELGNLGAIVETVSDESLSYDESDKDNYEHTDDESIYSVLLRYKGQEKEAYLPLDNEMRAALQSERSEPSSLTSSVDEEFKSSKFESNEPVIDEEKSNPYSPFGNDELSAFQKKPLKIQNEKSLNSSLSVSVDEELSASGNTTFVPIKLSEFPDGENIEQVKVLHKEQLGKGLNGEVLKVHILKRDNNDIPEVYAAKEVANPTSFKTEKRFYDYVTANQLQGMLIPFASIKGKKSKKRFTFMPMADFGNGDKLMRLLPALSKEERNIVIRHVMYSLIKTLYGMYQSNIIHLDLKPTNIIFNAKGDCFVCDFDFSVILNQDGSFYCKPDLIKFDSRFNPADDLTGLSKNTRKESLAALDTYRLGLTMFLLCISKPECLEENLNLLRPYKSVNKVLNGALDNIETINEMLVNAEVPDDIRLFIRGLLQNDLADRLTIVEAWKIVSLFKPADETDKAKVKEIFSKLEAINQEQKGQALNHGKDKEKERDHEQKQTEVVPIIYENIKLLMDLAAQNQGQMTGNVEQVIRTLESTDPSEIAEKLPAVLGIDRAKNTAKRVVGESARDIADLRNVGSFLSMHSLLGAAKRALPPKVPAPQLPALQAEQEPRKKEKINLSQSISDWDNVDLPVHRHGSNG